MTARRSSSDPVSAYLATGERIVWRHQPSPRALFFNRLPSLILILIFAAFIVWVSSMVIGYALPDTMPTAFSVWLLVPIAVIGFAVFVLSFYVRFVWTHVLGLLDSWSTHYALTDRRFMIVSGRGLIEYDASYFHQMEACDGTPGEQVLLFDYGPFGKQRRSAFRDRIAALPDAKHLERLIRDTLRA